MVLSKKSLHYWVYRQFFDKTPTNLCPYFWKTVISFIFFPVAFILALPFALILTLTDDEDHDKRLGPLAGMGLIAWFCLLLLSCMIGMIFWKNENVIGIGMVGWVVAFIIGLVALFSYLQEKKPFKETLVGEFIKAKKNKYCPKIEWKNDAKVVNINEDNHINN